MADPSAPSIKMISGKIVCEVHLLDNSMKTILIEASTTVEVRGRVNQLGARVVGPSMGLAASNPCLAQL